MFLFAFALGFCISRRSRLSFGVQTQQILFDGNALQQLKCRIRAIPNTSHDRQFRPENRIHAGPATTRCGCPVNWWVDTQTKRKQQQQQRYLASLCVCVVNQNWVLLITLCIPVCFVACAAIFYRYGSELASHHSARTRACYLAGALHGRLHRISFSPQRHQHFRCHDAHPPNWPGDQVTPGKTIAILPIVCERVPLQKLNQSTIGHGAVRCPCATCKWSTTN